MDFFTDNLQKKNDSNRVAVRKRELMIKTVAAFNRNERVKAHFVDAKRNVSDFDKPYVYLEGWKTEKIMMESFQMELLYKKSEMTLEKHAPQEEKEELAGQESQGKGRRVILQLHGGGYVNAFKNQYRRMAHWYSESWQYADVLSVDYRVAPEHVFPAALEDAVSAYQWLLEHGYEEKNIVVCGDSAGGGLTLSLCHYLRDHGMRLPAGLVCMSPWTDVTMSSASYQVNKDIDVILGMPNSIILENPYPGEKNPENPYISPLFGDFHEFPPILLQVGTNEVLLDDSLRLCKKAREAGVRVRLTQYEEMFHVFQLCGPVLAESKAAWKEIRRFFKTIDTERAKAAI